MRCMLRRKTPFDTTKRKIFHVAVGVRHGGMVIEHQQHAGDHQDDERAGTKANRDSTSRARASDFSRTLTGSQCRNRLPNTARLRVRLVMRRPAAEDGLPDAGCPEMFESGIEWRWPCSPQTFRTLIGFDGFQLVHQQFAVGGQGDRKMRQRPRRRTFDLLAVSAGICCRGTGRQSCSLPASTA